MKNIYRLLYILLFAGLTLCACMNSDEIETTPECAITAFSVGNISTQVTVHRTDDTDTVTTKVIDGSSIYFNIDQLKGIITTVDSLPKWVSLEKVVPSFTANGTVYCRQDGDTLFYQLTSGSDSISFEKPVEMISVATDGVSLKRYTVSINRSSYDLDTLEWDAITTDFNVSEDFKAIETDGHVFVFYEEDGNVKYTYAKTSDNLSSWTEPVTVQGGDIDYASIMTFGDDFYALGKDGMIYKAVQQNRPDNWEKTGEKTFSRLLATDKYYIYAFDGSDIVGSTNLETWTTCGGENVDMLPTEDIHAFSYESKTNSDIHIAMMCGLSEGNSKYGVSWYKVSSLDEDINQNWMYIQVTNDNPYGLPRFKDMSVTMYDGSLFAIGIAPNVSPDTYRYLYRSDDNGITWHPQKEKYTLPEGLDAANGKAEIVSADGKLWIIQKGGNVWSGVIR